MKATMSFIDSVHILLQLRKRRRFLLTARVWRFAQPGHKPGIELPETAAELVIWRVVWPQTPLATMLLLFETAAGYALFKVLNKGKIDSVAVRLRTETAA
jgi:hypothetical protein